VGNVVAALRVRAGGMDRGANDPRAFGRATTLPRWLGVAVNWAPRRVLLAWRSSTWRLMGRHRRNRRSGGLILRHCENAGAFFAAC
jgi:hypothetical protein